MDGVRRPLIPILFCLIVPSPAWAMEPQGAKRALFIVLVAPDAILKIQGHPTQQRGEVRRFQTKVLDSGKEYDYSLKAEWRVDGELKSRETSVRVQAGEEKVVDLRAEETPPLGPLPELIVQPPQEVPTPANRPPAPPSKLDPEPVPFHLILPSEEIVLSPGRTTKTTITVRRLAHDGAISFRLLGVPASVDADLEVLDPVTATVQITLIPRKKTPPLNAVVRCAAVAEAHQDEKMLRIRMAP